MVIDPSKLTRVEVIDDDGRVVSIWNTRVEISIQDAERTLKIFVKGSVGPPHRWREPSK